MIWNDVQRMAKEWGCLVYAIDQAQTKMMMQPGPWGKAHKGYCSGLAQRWMALRYENKDYAYDEARMECKRPDWQATRDQNSYLDAGGDLVAKLRAAFEDYGMSINIGGKVSGPGPATSARLLRGAAGEGCYYVSLSGTEVGHALGLEREKCGGKTRYRLFDANHGHFLLEDDKTFAFFFGHFMQQTGYNTQFPVHTEVVGVNPPRIDPSLLMGADLEET